MITLETLLDEQRDLMALLERDERAREVAEENERLREIISARGLEIPARRLMLADLALPIAFAYGVTVADLRGSARVHAVPRQHLMWKARQYRQTNGANRWSYPQIGRYLGGRDHTTVMHGEKAHEKRMAAGEVVVLPIFPNVPSILSDDISYRQEAA